MRRAFVARRRPHLVRAALAALLLAAALPAALSAQVEERPVTFDAGQRMTAITPMLAARMKLAAPAWPVTGEYREARVYAAGDAHVLVVQKGDGTLTRYPLDAGQWAALQAAVGEGMRTSGNPGGEPNAYTFQEVAGVRFARRQLLVGAVIHGPLLASFANDGETGSALYFTGVAMPPLLALGFSRDGVLTRGQADLGTAGSLRGAMLGAFAYRAFTDRGGGETDTDAVLALGGSVGMTMAGLTIGRSLTDGEAAGMVAGADYLLLATAGTLGSLGSFGEECERDGFGNDWCRTRRTSRGEYAALLGAGLVGYPLGLAYVRASGYAVTAGDAKALIVPASVGVLAGVAASGDRPDRRTRYAAMTGGLVAGLVVGDRFLVKPFDYTRSQATAVRTGAIAGAVLGLAPAALAEAEGPATAGLAAFGGTLGAVFAHRMQRPQRAMGGALREARRDVPDERKLAGRVTWQLDPMGAAMAAARAPGRHGILSLTF